MMQSDNERARRWRLVLGKQPQDDAAAQEAGGAPGAAGGDPLPQQDQAMARALESLYGDRREGDLSDSNPDIVRWLEDIRTYFPDPIVQIMQKDALDKLNLRRLLAQPEFVEAIEPDVNLVSNLLALRRMMPAKTRESAKAVVRKVVQALLEQLEFPLRQAINGSVSRALVTRRPRHAEINWRRTIRANLKHYQPTHQTIIPETLWGNGRKRSALRDVILALDTSGSMATSIVYGSIYGAVMASLPALATRVVMFDTAVVDLSDQLDDPVEMLFGLKLGGGTNIDRALAYCQAQITRPQQTILVLVSDLFEGGSKEGMVQRIATLVDAGVQVIVLLALNDAGAPRFDRQMAQVLVELGVPAFACTPQQFPDLMAAAINGRDIGQWAAAQNIVTAPDN